MARLARRGADDAGPAGGALLLALRLEAAARGAPGAPAHHALLDALHRAPHHQVRAPRPASPRPAPPRAGLTPALAVAARARRGTAGRRRRGGRAARPAAGQAAAPSRAARRAAPAASRRARRAPRPLAPAAVFGVLDLARNTRPLRFLIRSFLSVLYDTKPSFALCVLVCSRA